jgi:transposase, IS5 family
MKQPSLEATGFKKYRKKTRKEQFLDEMEQIIPWKELCEVIEPYYPKPQGAGRKPIGLERMLRIHFLQHWFELSDPGAEEVLYDSRAMRLFVGIDLGNEPVPVPGDLLVKRQSGVGTGRHNVFSTRSRLAEQVARHCHR